MEKIHSWAIPLSLLFFFFFFFFSFASSEQEDVKQSLIDFLQKLAPSNSTGIAQQLGWSMSTDPCDVSKGWSGIKCHNSTNTVKKVTLQDLPLGGSIDAGLLCKPQFLMVVSLGNNSLQGVLEPEISNCSQLTHLYLSGNRLSGALPSSLSSLKNLKRFDISNNEFSGEVPQGLTKISALLTFYAQDNKLNGTIPDLDFNNLQQFNASNNLFSGPIPEGGAKFGVGAYLGDSGLCGKPLNAVVCPPPPPPPPPLPSSPPTSRSEGKSKKSKSEKAIMYSGYIALGLVFLLFFAYKFVNRNRKRTNKVNSDKPKESTSSSGYKNNNTRSEYSITSSNEGTPVTGATTTPSMSLVVLKNSWTSTYDLKFEELLKAPAELLGRGRFGSLYKVMMGDGMLLAVKRIKDWSVTAQEFQRRMERLDRVKHRRVLPAVAFYCSKQEKLVVYEYKSNGSLFKLLHGSQEVNTFDWSSRLSVAAGIADAMAFMHADLHEVGIGHGNLKSSNIIFDDDMEPCVSEYGLLAPNQQSHAPPLPAVTAAGSSSSRKLSNDSAFRADVYALGVILLELLTGKRVENNGFDLAQWVNSVVREEWTVEVFDKVLTGEGVSEESMVRLLKVALRCIDDSPTESRPSMTEIASMINSVREEEDRSSLVSE